MGLRGSTCHFFVSEGHPTRKRVWHFLQSRKLALTYRQSAIHVCECQQKGVVGGGWEEDKEGRGTQMDGERQGSGVCEREKGEPYSQPGVHVTPPSTPPPLNPILYFGTPIPPVKLME